MPVVGFLKFRSLQLKRSFIVYLERINLPPVLLVTVQIHVLAPLYTSSNFGMQTIHNMSDKRFKSIILETAKLHDVAQNLTATKETHGCKKGGSSQPLLLPVWVPACERLLIIVSAVIQMTNIRSGRQGFDVHQHS